MVTSSDELTTGRFRVGDKAEIAQIRALYASGQIEAAMALADQVRVQESLPMNAVPVVTVTQDALLRLPLDHRAGFMLTRIDGISSVRSIIDIAAMPIGEALTILEKLLTVGALGLAEQGEERTIENPSKAPREDSVTLEPITRPHAREPEAKPPAVRKKG
jgi:hypothetical protein